VKIALVKSNRAKVGFGSLSLFVSDSSTVRGDVALLRNSAMAVYRGTVGILLGKYKKTDVVDGYLPYFPDPGSRMRGVLLQSYD